MAVKKETSEEKTVAAKKPAAKKTEKPAAEKKPAAKKTEKPAAEKKPAVKKNEKPAAEKKAAEIIIQSPMGGEITDAEILAKVGTVDKVYVRVDQNKAYWVRGEETGSVSLW